MAAAGRLLFIGLLAMLGEYLIMQAAC